MPSHVLIVHIAWNDDCARVTVQHEGGASLGPFEAPLGPFACVDLARRWHRIREAVPSWTNCGGCAREIGEQLFEATLGLVAPAYREALADVRRQRQRHRSSVLRVAISCTAPPLMALPWELLFDPEERAFLAAIDYISIHRQSNFRADEFWHRAESLRLLIVMAMPVLPAAGIHAQAQHSPVIDGLAFDRFLSRLQRQCGSVVRIRFLSGPESTPTAVRNALHDAFDILYFIGHSHESNGQTWFVLEDGTRMRRAAAITATELAGMLHASGVGCVFLSSCESGAAAAALARISHLHSVVAMQSQMPTISSSVFDEVVIRGITAGRSIEHSVMRGRLAICNLVRQITAYHNWEPTDRPEWAIPVLYMNADQLDASRSTFESGEYRVGVAEDHVATLARYPMEPAALDRCFRRAATVRLNAFALSERLVTNHQFRYYLEESGVPIDLPGFNRVGDCVELGSRVAEDGRMQALHPEYPVTGVTREEAEACCRWCGKRLPDADELEVWSRTERARTSTSRVFEWTRTNDADGVGAAKAVVVGRRDGFPITALQGFCVLREPRSGYADVGFRMAEDL